MKIELFGAFSESNNYVCAVSEFPIKYDINKFIHIMKNIH